MPPRGLLRLDIYDNRFEKFISFFMRSLLRTVPLIGALALSAAPVQAIEINSPQAFETVGEFDKACSASEENTQLCTGAIQYSALTFVTGKLCRLKEEGLLITEKF